MVISFNSLFFVIVVVVRLASTVGAAKRPLAANKGTASFRELLVDYKNKKKIKPVLIQTPQMQVCVNIKLINSFKSFFGGINGY